jgi:hypothetical protein
MPRLVPNPIGDLHRPLERIESAIGSLADKLRPVDSLPSVNSELVEVNKTLVAIHETLLAMRAELAGVQAPQVDGSAAKRGAPRARAAG